MHLAHCPPVEIPLIGCLCAWSTPHVGPPHHVLQADVDGSGAIDYYEFITATMHRHKLEREEHLYVAFRYFDKDNSG